MHYRLLLLREALQLDHLLDDLLDRSRVAGLPHGPQRGPRQLLVRRDRDRATNARKPPHFLAPIDRSPTKAGRLWREGSAMRADAQA